MRALRALLFVLLLGLVVSAGLAAATQLGHGLEETGKSRPVYWSAFIASLLFFTGIGHGAAWVALWATQRKRPAVLPAAALMAFLAPAVGGLNPLLHLGRPQLFYFTMIAPQPRSPLFWDMVLVQLFAGVAFLLILLLIAPGMVAKIAPRLRSASERLQSLIPLVAVAAAVLALAAEVVASWILTMTRNPMWSSPLHLPTALGGALAGGLALVALGQLALGQGAEAARRMGGPLLAAATLAFLCGATEHALAAFSADAAVGAVLWSKLNGAYATPFWTMAALTFLLPLLLLARPSGRSPRAVGAAAFLFLVGLWLERWVGIVATLSHPRLAMWTGTTALTGSEVRIVLGEAALVALGFALLARLLPRPEWRPEPIG